MSKPFFFGKPVEAQIKEGFEIKQAQAKQEHEEFCRQLNEKYQKEIDEIDTKARQNLVADIVSDITPYLPDLKEEDIDKISQALKGIKSNL